MVQRVVGSPGEVAAWEILAQCNNMIARRTASLARRSIVTRKSPNELNRRRMGGQRNLESKVEHGNGLEDILVRDVILASQ